MVTGREKARLNQMLLSGDMKNIELGFEMIINSEEDLLWIIWKAKKKLEEITVFFENKVVEVEVVIEEFYFKLYNDKDKFTMVESDILESEEMAKYYKDKWVNAESKCDVFLLVFREKEPMFDNIKSEDESFGDKISN